MDMTGYKCANENISGQVKGDECSRDIPTTIRQLLRSGYSMLNERCSVCMGILLGCRNSIEKRCVKCELKPSTINQTSSSSTNNAENKRPSAIQTISGNEETSCCSTEDNSEMNTFAPTDSSLHSLYGNNTEQIHHQADHHPLHRRIVPTLPEEAKNALRAAVVEVEKKMEWYTDRLRTTTNLDEIGALQNAILIGMEIIARFYQ